MQFFSNEILFQVSFSHLPPSCRYFKRRCCSKVFLQQRGFPLKRFIFNYLPSCGCPCCAVAVVLDVFVVAVVVGDGGGGGAGGKVGTVADVGTCSRVAVMYVFCSSRIYHV